MLQHSDSMLPPIGTHDETTSDKNENVETKVTEQHLQSIKPLRSSSYIEDCIT